VNRGHEVRSFYAIITAVIGRRVAPLSLTVARRGRYDVRLLEVPMPRASRAWSPVVLFLVSLFLPSAVRAQSVTGAIQGVVADASGAVLPGVTVNVVNAATGASRVAVTNEQGFFAAELLPVGTYEVSAELAGFQTRRAPDVLLTVGQTVTLRIELGVAAVQETVTVTGAAPVLETTRSQVSATVGATAIASLPVNGRNFIDFVLLTPGVTRDVRGGDISFAGQRGTLNSLVVDGADNNNTFFGQTVGRTGSGRAPYQFSQEAVQEFQVNSSAYSAEYGRAGGAVINVVTKSGTNTPSGAVFEYYRDKALNANSYINELLGRPKSPYHYHQFGVVLGGPLRRDRDFFFVNYDGQRNTQPNPVFLNLPASLPGDAATQAGIAALQSKAGNWTRGQNQDVFLAKTDHQLTDAQRVTLRYNHQNFTGRNFENGGPQNSIEHTGDSKVRTRSFNGTLASVFGGNLFNEAKAQWARDEEPGFANSENPEATIFEGANTVLTIGRNNFSPRETTITRWQFADTLTWVSGAHKVKGGVDVQFDDILNFFPGFFGGAYTFRSLASFAGGRPTGATELYQQNFAGPGTSGAETNPNIREYSVFLQDEWRVSSALTVNAGVRYDLMKTDPPPVRNPDAQLAAADIDTSRLDADTNNIAPRLGLAWAPAGRRIVARAGVGMFYGRTPSIMLGTAHSNNGINIVSLTFRGDQVPTYPATFSSIPAGGTAATPSIFFIDKDFANPRLVQASAGVDWEVLPNTSASVNYLFVDGSQLPRSIDENVGSAATATFTDAATGQAIPVTRYGANRPFANFARVISFESTAESRYNGVTFELNRRFGSGFQLRGSYTLGRVEDTVPDATAVVPGNAGDDAKYASDPRNFDADRTDGNNDQRHRFVASGTLITDTLADGFDGPARTLIGGWTFSAIVQAQTGQPYSARVGAADLNNDGNTRNDLAPGTVRNQFRLPGSATVDLRVARDIPVGRLGRVTLIGEAFNLFNDDIVSAVNTGYYNVNTATSTLTPNAAFGTPTASIGERIIQLAVKFAF
jgi:outer membrane receptor protein involved in Fe transport